MPDIIRKPELYGGRYNGMNLADRTREYERDMYLYTIAKSMQNNNQDESYKHLKMAKDIDSIIEDDYYYEEDYIDEDDNTESDELDELKDKYMKLRELKAECESKSNFTPIQDIDWCIEILAYIGAFLTIPFETVSTPLAFVLATVITLSLIFGQKIYRAKMRDKAESLKLELKNLRKEIRNKEKRVV